jgi:hypothetical protein
MKRRIKFGLLSTCMILLCSGSSIWCLLTPKEIPNKKNLPCNSELTNSDQEDRKLTNEATPVEDVQMTDPTKGSEMNKVDVKSSDEYDKMDFIVNDIKQVI